MSAELEKWRTDFEKKWRCRLTITPAPAQIEIEPSKMSACPLCDEPIYHNQDAEIGVCDGIKTLIHSDCNQRKQ